MTLCWGISDGSAGMESQIKALAAAIGVLPVMKKVTLKKTFAILPNKFYATPLKSLIVPYLIEGGSDVVAPPWPDMVISCGRRAGAVVMGLKRHIRGNTKFIHLQDPKVSARHFDMVVTVDHDAISGANVIKTRFALHMITPATLEEARQKFIARFAAYPQPLTAVLLGGTTHRYTLTTEGMAKIIMSLQLLLQRTEGSLLITPSRRTGEGNISMLRNVFAANKRVYIYDFKEENPYCGMLALADAIIVTNDSVNMMSEAHATSKPIYILPLPGHTESKPARFAQALIRDGIARPLNNKLEKWNYPASDEMAQLAREIKTRLA